MVVRIWFKCDMTAQTEFGIKVQLVFFLFILNSWPTRALQSLLVYNLVYLIHKTNTTIHLLPLYPWLGSGRWMDGALPSCLWAIHSGQTGTNTQRQTTFHTQIHTQGWFRIHWSPPQIHVFGLWEGARVPRGKPSPSLLSLRGSERLTTGEGGTHKSDIFTLHNNKIVPRVALTAYFWPCLKLKRTRQQLQSSRDIVFGFRYNPNLSLAGFQTRLCRVM